jgi:membrane protein DedA with SNARE-associated domain
MEHFVNYFATLNPLWIYCVAGAIAYMENVFPPLPSDVIVVAAGSFAALGRVDFTLLLLFTTAGSTAGFLTMYKIGDWFGLRILETGKLKYIPIEQIHKVESWFKMYGYWIVIANRFLAGTRAVISFFTGLSELSLWRTSALSFLSSLLWNIILIFAGTELGRNWREISVYLLTYGKVVSIIVLVGLFIIVSRSYYKNRNQQITSMKSNSSPTE